MKPVKFSSQMRPELLNELRQVAADSGRTLASILDEASELYLRQMRIRPAYREAVEVVINENDDLLNRLSRAAEHP